jgi:hypothetical protein
VPDFYVERAFAKPLTVADERSLLDGLIACGLRHGVRLKSLLVDGDQNRIVCGIEAGDLRGARDALRCAGFEDGAGWLAEVTALRATEPEPEPARSLRGTTNTAISSIAVHPCARADGLVDVIAECSRELPIEAASLTQARQACRWCLDTFRVQPGPLVVSTDRRRILAFFRAPDAEAVRACYRHASVPFDRVVALRRVGQTIA